MQRLSPLPSLTGLLLLSWLGSGCNIGKMGPLDWDGGGGPCQDACSPEGNTVCAGPLVKACRRSTSGCLSTFLEECSGGQICLGNACASAPVVWSTMPSGTGAALLAVWGSSGSDVFAVGERGTILHYDGSAWSAQESGTTLNLNGVWGSSGSDVFAVGLGGTILRYDGTAWSAPAIVPDVCLGDVWGSSGSDVYAFGSGGFLRYDGATWSVLATPAGIVGGYPGCGRLWGSSPTDVFGVGYWVYRFNGATWSGAVADPVHGDSVWGSAWNDVFVVGECVFHYDGSTWSTHVPCDDWNRYGIWGSSADNVFTVGRTGGISRYDGSVWTAQNSGTKVGLHAVWGSSATSIFAVGEGGTIVRYTP